MYSSRSMKCCFLTNSDLLSSTSRHVSSMERESKGLGYIRMCNIYTCVCVFNNTILFLFSILKVDRLEVGTWIYI